MTNYLYMTYNGAENDGKLLRYLLRVQYWITRTLLTTRNTWTSTSCVPRT